LREYSGAEASFTILRLSVHVSLAELYASALDLD
jgi:hypothetical protein